METEDRFVIPASGASFFPLILLILAGVAFYHGKEPGLIPVGLVLIPAGFYPYRRNSQPLVLDKKADRILGYPMALSTVLKVVVKEIGMSEGSAYAVELVFPGRTVRLTRGSLPQNSGDADSLAKEVAAFLGILAETIMPFYASFSFKKGFHLTKEQAEDAEKAGVKVDPRAIK
jgi:hypothetical protein